MKKSTFLLITLFNFSSISALAGENQEIDKMMQKYGDEARTVMNESHDALQKGILEVEEYFNHPGEMKKPQESFFGFGGKRVPQPSPEPSKSCGNCRTRSQRTSALKPSADREVIVFVSLSMSDASLKQLALEAEKAHARLVIRGLLENSFKVTMPRLQQLQIPLEIDPPLFDQFKVERVPTFVRCLLQQGDPVVKGHDRLQGNIPLTHALKLFKEKGTLS